MAECSNSTTNDYENYQAPSDDGSHSMKVESPFQSPPSIATSVKECEDDIVILPLALLNQLTLKRITHKNNKKVWKVVE